jgi:NTP pyrophosphatase (non-canonical NTP hydrolase)
MGVSDVTEPIDRLRALTFTEFSAANRQRCEAPDGFKHALHSWSTSDWFLAVFGELGEAANIAKKLNRVRDGIPGNKESADALRDKLRREIGDAFVYLDLLAQSLGVDIGAAAVEVFNAKSVEIGYPHALSAVPRALGGGEAQRPQARTLRERATMNILTVMEPWPDSTKKITRQLLSALERAEREIESLSVAASLPGGGITPPTEQPADAQGRLMLNAYGRQCYDLGFAAGADSHSITPPDQPGEQANGD